VSTVRLVLRSVGCTCPPFRRGPRVVTVLFYNGAGHANKKKTFKISSLATTSMWPWERDQGVGTTFDWWQWLSTHWGTFSRMSSWESPWLNVWSVNRYVAIFCEIRWDVMHPIYIKSDMNNNFTSEWKNILESALNYFFYFAATLKYFFLSRCKVKILLLLFYHTVLEKF